MKKRIAAWLMAAAVLVSLLPGKGRAEENLRFAPVEDMQSLCSGQYILLSSEDYAPGALHNGWLAPVHPVSEEPGPEAVLWQLEVSRDGVLLHDPRGTAVAPGESDAAGLTEGECLWQVSCTDGRFSFHALAGDTAVTLARVSDIGFCICDDRILQESYDAGFTLLRLTEESGEAPSDPAEDPSDPAEDPSDPAEDPSDPAEDPSDPAEDPSDPAEDPSDPAEDPSDPTEDPSDPTEDPSDPAEDPSDPTEPPTDPEEEPEVPQGPRLYFGLLHAHTADSDGAGTPAQAYAYASEVAGLDFFAVTDHSNSFDGADRGILSEDASAVSEVWRLGREAAKHATTDSFLALYGFEMTWQSGLGHISTFFTPGFQSRKQPEFAAIATGLETYYDILGTVPGSVSQFNHPGTFYGEFEDFAHYSEEADKRMQLLEVGCEGVWNTDAYNRALDKGWHVAPTASPNTHACPWDEGDASRTAVFADGLTEQNLAKALDSRRVYATQDADLQILYRLEGQLLGSVLQEHTLGETVTLTASVSDPTDEAVGTVEVIVDGGAAAASAQVTGSSDEITFVLPASYSYYYLRITQSDGDLAVTAPVWINRMPVAEIVSFTSDTALAVQNRPVALRLQVQNREQADFLVEKITFTAEGRPVGTLSDPADIPGNSSRDYEASLTLDCAGLTPIRVTVSGNLAGVPMECTADLELTFMNEDLVTTLVADGSHGTLPSLKELEAVAAEHRMVLVQVQELTPEVLSSCDLLLIPAPERPYEESYVNLIEDYLGSGCTLILCGAADGKSPEAADRLNALLTGLGLTARFRDDTAYDPVHNGGNPQELVTNVYNEGEALVSSFRNPWYQTWGCTLEPGQGTWLVKGRSTAYSVDGDEDGTAGQSRGEAVLLAREETVFGGSILYSGGMFLGDDVLDPGGEFVWEEPNGNGLLLEAVLNIHPNRLEVSTVSQARLAAEGEPVRIRGHVTAGTAVEANRFPGEIYIQDATGGLRIVDFPDPFLSVGTAVELIVQRQGDAFRLLHWQTLEEAPYNYLPREVSCADASDFGQYPDLLVKTEGLVVNRVLTADGKGVSAFTLEDREGKQVTVRIEAPIRSASTGENTLAESVAEGNWVSAVGIVYRQEGQTVLRVRNCDEVLAIRETGKTYRVVKGEYSVWIREEGGSIYMEVEGPAAEFLDIEVNGTVISKGNYYTVDDRYLVFRFWPRYLRTLSVGTHSVVFKFRDGEAKAALVVWSKADNPYTGDTLPLHLGLMFLSGGLLLKKHRRR